MSRQWVRIRAWHALRLTRSIEPRTACGRIAKADAEIVDTLPGASSCESCLRITARQDDR